jgi:hypothetical protein
MESFALWPLCFQGKVPQFSTRDQTVRFACVTSLWVEGKQPHILCKPQTLSTQDPRQRAAKYCRWKKMCFVWTENIQNCNFICGFVWV